MTCLLVDDEPLARQGLQLLIAETPQLTVAGEAESADQAAAFLDQQPVDVLFLDIDMPGVSGLSLLKTLPRLPITILTTAYPQFALDGYELNVTDYLLKPIRLDRFLKAVQKAVQQLQLQQKDSAMAPITLFVKTGRSYVPVKITDIQYIEGLKDYVLIHTSTDRLLTALTLKQLEASLPPTHFRRVNKSCIINVAHIQRVETDLLVVAKREITIGDRYRTAFFQKVIQAKTLGL
ncbi:MAG: response regulator transcription factor [Bacteroidetes bacterium]|nr:response regulator transcription factor [Fibrella sp.]